MCPKGKNSRDGEFNMDFWLELSKAVNLISLSGFVLSSCLAVQFWREKRVLKKNAQFVRPVNGFPDLAGNFGGVTTPKPVAFAISLISSIGSIKKSVETFLEYSDLKMNVEELVMNDIKSEEDIGRFINELRKKRRFLSESGFTEIHLFIAGPVQAGTIVGSVFSNGMVVKLYQRPHPEIQSSQLYQYWAPLVKM